MAYTMEDHAKFMAGSGITNTLDLGGGQKIQDYLEGAGVSTQGPGGGTLYTAGGGTAAGGGTIPRTYQGDSKYGSLVNEYFGSNFYKPTNHMGQAMFEDPLFGNYSSQSGAGVYGSGFMDYLQNAQEGVMRSLTTRLKHSPETLERFNLISEAYNKMFPGGTAFYEPGAGSAGGAPQGMNLSSTGQILGPDGNPMQPFLGDTSSRPLPVEGPLDPATGLPSIFGDPTETAPPGSPGPDMGFGPSNMQPINPDTTDSFGIGSNPVMNNPIAPMPSMPTAPNTQPGHSHDDLLSGIGKLFEQYFPQQGSQQINQPSPMFDAAGNSVPDGQTQSSQIFGNMITPNFGGGY